MTYANHFELSTSNRQTRIVYAGILMTVVVLASLPFWLDSANIRLATEMLCYLALAQMWNLLVGYGGLLSVGQQAFVGFGGYLLFAACMFLGIHPLLAVPLAGLGAALLAVPTGLVAFRLQGPYFAIGTWVIAEVFRLIAAQITVLGGGSGISLPTSIARSVAEDRGEREAVIFGAALFLALLAVGGVWALMRSRWGLALSAIRDSEQAAASVGVRTSQTKFLVYVGAALITGATGGLLFLQKLRISPEAAFSVNDWTIFVIFIVVIGGLGTIEGPILGVIIFFALRWFAADWGSWYLIFLGAIAISVMLVDRKGVWPRLRAFGIPGLFDTSIHLVTRKADEISVMDAAVVPKRR